MGTDDLHKKRNTKIRGRKTRRKENEIILIVCEGEKTEKNYLNQLKDFFKLINVSINIISSKDSDPLKIVNFAEKKAKKIFMIKFIVYLIKISTQVLTMQSKNVINVILKQLSQFLVLNFGYFCILHIPQNHLVQ